MYESKSKKKLSEVNKAKGVPMAGILYVVFDYRYTYYMLNPSREVPSECQRRLARCPSDNSLKQTQIETDEDKQDDTDEAIDREKSRVEAT